MRSSSFGALALLLLAVAFLAFVFARGDRKDPVASAPISGRP
jgi:hypothetical protein